MSKSLMSQVVLAASLSITACGGGNDDEWYNTDGNGASAEQPAQGAALPLNTESNASEGNSEESSLPDEVQAQAPDSTDTDIVQETTTEDTEIETVATVDSSPEPDPSEVATPVVTAPVVSTPEPTTPVVTAPVVTTPEPTTPVVTTPEETTQVVTAPAPTVTEPVAAKIEPPVGYAGEITPVVTPSESDPFSKFQLDDALYTNNVYDGRQLDAANNWKLIFYDGVQDFVRWDVPALLGNDPSPCARPQADSPLTLSYRLTSRKDSPTERNTFVRAFPAMVVGTMGGRYESWGVECGQASTILPSVQRHGGSPVYQMETVADETGLPVLAGDLDFDVRVSVKGDLTSSTANTGLANVFMDSYWHNVSDIDIVPGNESQLLNTINGISSDYTEVWNLNIWFDYPRTSGRASSWTGGFKIGSVTLQEGGEFDIYYKIEGSRDGHIPLCQLGTNVNCFLYIGLVSTDDNAARNGITINYTEIADWMRTAEFRDLFLSGAFESDTPAARAYESWRLIDGTENDSHPDPAKRGPRFPDENHVIGGIHLGAELWYNPDAIPASIEFEALGVDVEGFGQFGRFINY